MTYRDAFPDFAPAGMPAIPAAWSDISWHNDACPSFDAGNDLLVYVDYAEPDLREMPGGERFTVVEADSGRLVLASDDWSAILKATGVTS